MTADPTGPVSGDSRQAGRLVAFNTAVQLAARVAASLLGVVQVAILSHYLHSRGYGQYTFVLAVVGLCVMLTDMGLTQVAVRAVAADHTEERSRTMGAVLAARFYLALAALALNLLFALVAPIDPAERTGIAIMSVFYLITVPNVLTAVYQAELELQFSLAINVGQTAVGVALTFLLAMLRAPLLAFLAVQLPVTAAASVLAYGIAVRRYRLAVRPGFRRGLGVLRESLPVGISQVLVVLYFRIDSILLGLQRGAVDVGHYAAAYKFVDLGSFAAVAFATAVYPVMVRQARESDRSRLLHAYQRSTDVMMLAAIPLTVGLFILARPAVFLVYPGDFVPSVGALRILTLVLIPLFFNNVLGPLVLTLHRERTFLWVSLGATVLNIGLNLAFIPAFGITAASIVTVVSEVFVTAAGSIIMWRVLGVLPSLRATGLAVFAAALMALPVYLLRAEWIAAALAGAMVYAAATRALRLWSWSEVRDLAGFSA